MYGLGEYNSTPGRQPRYFCLKQDSGHSNVASYTCILSLVVHHPLPVLWEVTVIRLNVGQW